MAAVIGQPGSNFKPKHQQVTTARAHSVGAGLSQLAQGRTKPEPQFDHLQDTPLAAARRRGDAAEVHAEKPPVVTHAPRDLRHTELTGRIVALKGALLCLCADGDGNLAVSPHAHVAPVERLVLQIARATRSEELLLVDNESKWADEREIVAEQRAELVGIPTSLGVSPATPKLEDLPRGCCVLIAHGFQESSRVVFSAGPRTARNRRRCSSPRTPTHMRTQVTSQPRLACRGHRR